jgi:DNA replication protein DnaC
MSRLGNLFSESSLTPCSLLVQELLRAKKDLRLARVLKKFSRYDALIIDDIGYVQQDRQEMEVLFTLLADRYERGSIMLSSNLPFSRCWTLDKILVLLGVKLPFCISI